jgi:DNA-binding NarL/FixJ family response regulator
MQQASDRPRRNVGAAPIRVVVGDDELIAREYIATLLDAQPGIDVVAVPVAAADLAAAIIDCDPDVVVASLEMPPSGALDTLRIAARLRAEHPTTGLVVLSRSVDPLQIIALFAGGIKRRAYLVEQRLRNRDELVLAVRAVAAGESMIDPAVVEVLAETRNTPRSARLTLRERELLGEIARGKSNGGIAADLKLTTRAVEKHVNAIYAKLGLRAADDISPRVMATLIYLEEGQSAR